MNLTEQSYSKLKEYLLSSDIQPETRFSINELSRRLGVGRSPVRDAVIRLTAEGLLESADRSGLRLKPLSRSDLQEIVELREALEPYAARVACSKIDYQQLREMKRLLEAMRNSARKLADSDFQDSNAARDMAISDRRFHEKILDAADNGRLGKIVRNYQLLAGKVRYPSSMTVRHLALTVLEHWRVYTSLVNSSPEGAEFWMMRHARRGGREMMRSFTEVYGTHNGH